MQYTQLGNSGLLVSRLSLGTLTFTQGDRSLEAVYKVEREQAKSMIDCAIAGGVNFFDTADVYASGEAESLLGELIRPHRQNMVIATKVGNRGSRNLMDFGLSRRHILKSVDESLRRLGTDWIDFYVAHREDPYTSLEETVDALDAVVRAGKVRYIGFSNWTPWRVSAAMEIQKAKGLAPFTHGQMYYSLLGREVERDLMPMLRHYGLGMTVWSPLAFGFLSGAYSREDLHKPDNRFSNFDVLQIDREKAFAMLDVIRGIAGRHEASVAQVAIAWLLSRAGVDSVIIGATRLSQLEQNLGALDLNLSEQDLTALDDASTIPVLYPSSDWMGTDPVFDKALGNR